MRRLAPLLFAGAIACSSPGAAPTARSAVTPSSSSIVVPVCGHVDHPIDPLDRPHAGEVKVAEGAGCGPGQIPSDRPGFVVDTASAWTVYVAFTCDGVYRTRPFEAALFLAAHNTVTGADLTPGTEWGPWGYGKAGLTGDVPDAPPAGTYVLRVTVANPEAHKCQWHVAVFRR
jgi:hypothetical protein